ncbi:hypothetical protein N7523_000269 [Penicillium sp. IBT 18751x]|nr:hypothetical protein N7523_000269 [Penicillium sp. IBT 18751x]
MAVDIASLRRPGYTSLDIAQKRALKYGHSTYILATTYPSENTPQIWITSTNITFQYNMKAHPIHACHTSAKVLWELARTAQEALPTKRSTPNTHCATS